MDFVERIRDRKRIAEIKNLLRGQGYYRDLLLFVAGINTALRTSDLLRTLSTRSHVVFLGRASAGIAAALRAWGLHNQRVLIQANTCYIVGWAVLQSGNQPFLVDVEPSTGNLSSETLDQVRLNHVGAVIVCHMYGLGAPMRHIAEWARQRDLLLIEDATLALGTTVDGRPAGSWGDLSLLSFGAGKIADVGNGGALLTDDPLLADKIARALHALPEWNPRLEKLQDQWLAIYWALHQFEEANPRLLALYPLLYDVFGEITRYRLPDFPHADLQIALETLAGNLSHRAEVAAIYRRALTGLPAVHFFDAPPGSITWRYPLRIDPVHRDDLLNHLWAEGFHDVTRWYPSLRHMLSQLTSEPCFERTPGADQLGAEVINLPVDDDVDIDTALRLSAVLRTYFDYPMG